MVAGRFLHAGWLRPPPPPAMPPGGMASLFGGLPPHMGAPPPPLPGAGMPGMPGMQNLLQNAQEHIARQAGGVPPVSQPCQICVIILKLISR